MVNESDSFYFISYEKYTAFCEKAVKKADKFYTFGHLKRLFYAFRIGTFTAFSPKVVVFKCQKVYHALLKVDGYNSYKRKIACSLALASTSKSNDNPSCFN